MKQPSRNMGMKAIFILVVMFSAMTAAAQQAASFVAVSGDWKGSVFGDVGGQDKITGENFEITEKSDGTVTLRSSNDRGKIASTSEGIAFYFREIPADADFELKAKVVVGSFAKNNQVSFGLMVRDRVLDNTVSKDPLGSYLAVGPVNLANTPAQYAFSRTSAGLVKKNDIVKSAPPAPGATYELGLKKSGTTYVLTFGEEEPVVMEHSEFSGSSLFTGLFTSRNANVTFSNVTLEVDTRKVSALDVKPGTMKTSYLQGEPLVLSGLSVVATYTSGETEILGQKDYIVTGFDSSSPGSKVLSVLYGGKAVEIPIMISPLELTSLDVVFPPLATDYHLLDSFKAEGLVVRGSWNEGYKTALMEPGTYRLEIEGRNAEGYVFRNPGKIIVKIVSAGNVKISASFTVSVQSAELLGLEIGRSPLKTKYFTGDRLDPTGMSVFARYGDGSRIRLFSGEYAVSPLDSGSPGARQVDVSYKGVRTSFRVDVAERKAIGLEVSSFPKTTYVVGEPFDPDGLGVTRVFDNGDREVLSKSSYSLDTSGLDMNVSGIRHVVVLPKETGVKPISFSVAVRNRPAYDWKFIRFGQSTRDTTNTMTAGADGSVRLVALEGGGKVTGDHDGISFYYTELDAAADNFVLEADIKVIAYAKNPHDGQESFGLMARDAIGEQGDSSVFASNIAAVGGYSGGTRNENGTQLFVRTGVTTPDGAGSLGVRRAMLKNEKPEAKNTHPAAAYRLSLEKTNSGFRARLNDGPWAMMAEPGILGIQDGKMYVGFYTARLATIEVSSIKLNVTASAADAPRIVPPPEPVAPTLEILSPEGTSSTDYSLVLRTNAAGTLLVKQGYSTAARDLEIKAGEEVKVPALLVDSGSNPFGISFVPDDRQKLTAYAPLVRNFLVTTRSYVPGGDIRVSPAGTPDGDGTAGSPLDLDTAVAFVRTGQKIILADGKYLRSASLVIRKYNDGKPLAVKYLIADAGSRPVIDFQRKSAGVVLSADYWYVRGIDFARSASNTQGFVIGGDRNTVNDCRFYENGDTGLQISRTDPYDTSLPSWPSYNMVMNCESYDNRDPSENNADGFAAKITSGVGNAFRHCIAHNNIDDGWDLYTKAGSGAIGAVTIESCVAFANGTLSDGKVGRGDKNGFKLGGEGIAVPHVIRNSLAFGNGASGFTNNSNPSLIAENNFAYDNGSSNLNLSVYAGGKPDFRVDGFFSFRTTGTQRDIVTAVAASGKNFLFNGTSSVNADNSVLGFDAFVERLELAGFPKGLLNRKR